MSLYNLEAEQAVLGMILFENSHYEIITGQLKAEQFYEPFHQRAYTAMGEIIEKRGFVDGLTLTAALSVDQAFTDLGGLGYFVNLRDVSPPLSAVVEYCSLIRDCWARRQITEISIAANELISQTGRSPLDAMSYLRRSVDALEKETSIGDDGFLGAQDVANRVIASAYVNSETKKPRGLRTGLICFDQGTNGMYPGDLIILGGKSGMAKTGLARNAAHGVAKHNPDHQVLFIGIEMGPDEMMQRELSYLTKTILERPVTYQNIARDDLNKFEIMALEDVVKHVPKNLILQDVLCKPSLEDVRRAVWTLKRKGPIAAVFIDYLGLMQLPEAKGRNDAALWGIITSGLKQIARQAKCTIVCLSQLSRQSDARENNRPVLSDLRDSGAIEQDADCVMFVYREHYYLTRQGEPKKGQTKEDYEMKLFDCENQMDAIVAKARRGPTKTFKMYCDIAHDVVSNPTH